MKLPRLVNPSPVPGEQGALGPVLEASVNNHM